MAVDMFLKIDGIDGESNDDKHKKEIEVLSFEWDLKQTASHSGSSAGSLTSGRVDPGEFTITKEVDAASPKLMLACCSGEHIKSIRLELCRAGGDKQPFMEYKFTDVIVAKFEASGEGEPHDVVTGQATGHRGHLPLEEISFAFGKADVKYTQTKVEGGKGSGNVAAGWDFKTNKKV